MSGTREGQGDWKCPEWIVVKGIHERIVDFTYLDIDIAMLEYQL